MPGGASDKAGNAYEELWTALRIADLLRGEASSIQLEPVGADGLGIEFQVQLPDGIWGEQTKHSSSSWTINRLKDEGALAAAKHHVDGGRGYRLVTSSAADALEKLADRARIASSVDQFESILPDKLRPALDDLVKHWGDPREVAWRRLRKIAVEHHPLTSLRRIVNLAFEILYSGEPDLVVAAVSAFCTAHMHETLRASQVATYLDHLGFAPRLLAGDKNTRRLLHRTVARQERRVHESAPQLGLVPRPDVQAIVQDLLDADCPQLLLIDAPAGYGKTAVATAVATTMESQGWCVAVVRLDNALAIPTSRHLGEHMGLEESPAITLMGASEGAAGLLVIDQLDAISLFSGRMPDNFEAIAEVIDELRQRHNVRVLLVSRTTDVENDPRMRALVRAEGATRRHTLGRLHAGQLHDYLTSHGVQTAGPETEELLRTPLHLAAYLLLSEGSRASNYRTLQDLYDRLTTDIRRRVEQRAGALDWRGITTLMVETMSGDETLTVASARLDRFPATQLAALESEGLLVSDSGGYAFFHESYFDYLFARAFIDGGGDLLTFLAESGQALFRRAQTRQVLEHLAATDRPRFRGVAKQLLESTTIRSHLKHVVVGVLRAIEPQPEDWEAVEEVAWSDVPIGPHVIALLSHPGWFEAADELHRWEAWLNDPARLDAAMNQLVPAARHHGDRIADLVRPHIGESEQWRLWLRALVSWSLTPELVPLAVELIEGGHIDDARGPIAVNSDFWSIVHTLLTKDPVGATRVTGSFLRRGLEVAQAEGSGDPFESGHLSTHSTDESIFIKMAKGAPREFLQEVLPFVVAVATVGQHDLNGHLPVGRRWGYRWRSTHYSVDDALFEATEVALTSLAATEPDVVKVHIEPLRGCESEELRFLACRALTALDDADDAIRWLTGDPRNLVLGWADNPRWASRELIEKHSLACSADLFAPLEVAILAHESAFENRPTGHGQYVLLSGLNPDRMSEQGRRRLAELDRKFDTAPSAPRPIEAAIVGSPIPMAATAKMPDANWLAALRKHASEETRWSADEPVGGARELAQLLELRAKEEPGRFARLALQFDSSIPATAGSHVLRGAHANIEPALLTAVCEHLADLYGEAVGRDICSAVEAANERTAEMVALIERYSTSSDPTQELARTPASSGGDYYGGDLFMAGLNCTRGGAALAAASTLFGNPPFLNELRPVIERLSCDPIMAVRTCAANGVIALLNHDTAHALVLAEALFDGPIDILDARTTEQLLMHCIVRSPLRFAAQLDRALNGSDSVARRGGHIWAVAQLRGALPPGAPNSVDALPSVARVGAAQVLAENAFEGAQSLGWLFQDPDARVRAAAALGMRNLNAVAADTVDGLIEAFVRSASFPEHMDHLFDALGDLGTRLPKSTLDACQRAVELSGTGLGDIRTARAGLGQDIVTIVLRLYRQGDDATRSACLDVVDRLMDAGAHGVADALADER